MDRLSRIVCGIAAQESKGWHYHTELALAAALVTPKHYGAARKSPQSEQWSQAESKEWTGLWDRGCFEDVPLKARLVLDGRQQDPSTYGDIRSPTMRLTSMRILAALSAQRDWQLMADDASQAFIQSERPQDKPLWCAYPPGHKKHGRCMLLKRYLYGCHDSPKAWYDNVRHHLVEEQGMRQSRVDDCCFVGTDGVICVLHVDDFLSTGPPAALAKFRKQLYAKYDMSGGTVKEYYGLDFSTAGRAVTISAKGYIERACRKLGIKPGTWLTPMETELSLPKLSGECTNKVLHSRYRSLVGAINHAAVTVRVDVAVAVRELASHLVHPNAVHVKAAERVMGYLYHTREMGLRYTGEGDTARPLCLSFFGTSYRAPA
jgi:hypothetical protein